MSFDMGMDMSCLCRCWSAPTSTCLLALFLAGLQCMGAGPGQGAARAGSAAFCAPAPPFAQGAWPRRTLSGAHRTRAALEDREDEVAKIRAASRRVLGGLLQRAVENANANARGAPEIVPGGMKSAQPTDDADDDGVVVGILGRAAMASHIAIGLCRHADPALALVLGCHDAAWPASLQEEWPERVHVARNKQEVVAKASVVCLAIGPDELDAWTRDVSFREEHTVISLVQGASVAHVCAATSPAATVVRVVPTSQMANGLGPMAMYPRNDDVAAIFDGVVSVLVADNEDELSALATASALAAPLGSLRATVEAWLEAKGVNRVIF